MIVDGRGGQIKHAADFLGRKTTTDKAQAVLLPIRQAIDLLFVHVGVRLEI